MGCEDFNCNASRDDAFRPPGRMITVTLCVLLVHHENNHPKLMLWPRRLNAEDRAPSLAFWMRFNSHYKGDDCFCPVFLPPPTLLSIPLYYELFCSMLSTCSRRSFRRRCHKYLFTAVYIWLCMPVCMHVCVTYGHTQTLGKKRSQLITGHFGVSG